MRNRLLSETVSSLLISMFVFPLMEAPYELECNHNELIGVSRSSLKGFSIVFFDRETNGITLNIVLKQLINSLTLWFTSNQFWSKPNFISIRFPRYPLPKITIIDKINTVLVLKKYHESRYRAPFLRYSMVNITLGRSSRRTTRLSKSKFSKRYAPLATRTKEFQRLHLKNSLLWHSYLILPIHQYLH